jgi:ketosteroid isomerase-like protein
VSRENVELVRRGYEAYEQTDFETLLGEILDPAIEVHPVPDLPDWRAYRGHDGFLTWLQIWFEPWDEYTWDVREIADGGGNVVLAHQVDRGRSSTTGVVVENELWVVWRVKRKRLCQVSFFYREREALDAAGLHRWPAAS